MIDPRLVAVLTRDRETGSLVDRTTDVASCNPTGSGMTDVTFRSGRTYSYRSENVRLMDNPAQVLLAPGSKVEVRGVLWGNPVEVVAFTDSVDRWLRIFARRADGDEFHRIYLETQVRVLEDAGRSPAAAEVLRYWRDVLAGLREDDPLQRPYSRLNFVHPESALADYLAGAPIESRGATRAPIFPFRCNLSQRAAVELGLSRSISVIEGPPGTGKTETILNLIANIVTARAGSVAVVSLTNSAVDNVRDKLENLGFGYVIASLGRSEKREQFFDAQAGRNAAVRLFAAGPPSDAPPAKHLEEMDTHLRKMQEAERARAGVLRDIDAYRLERRHFVRHLAQHEAPDLERLPLLRKSADRILDYLAETEIEHQGIRPGLLRRIRRYFKYGSLRGLDPGATDAVLELQRAYYDKRIAELEAELGRLDKELRHADFDRLVQVHQQLSLQTLSASLGARYRSLAPVEYSAKNYRQRPIFAGFVEDYPVLLSTCHSLRDSIANGYLLDYLIIDEASQVDLLAAGLALSCCRRVIIVGDLKQLPPILKPATDGPFPPRSAFDYQHHSIITSLIELYGEDLPRTLLREHYRCDPAIIGFCNKAFYQGDLIPFRASSGKRPMIVVRTVEGNHMRQYTGGGRSNQREIDVIVKEVIPSLCAEFVDTEIGVTTPYRRQVTKAADALIEQIESDTIHKFQGRQKPVVILTTVLDETWRGRTGLNFADDAQKINVAVSRAIDRFILVTNHAMMPTSRNIRDLIGYIGYLNPGEEVVDSTVVSMFDLLYRDYNRRLRPLAERLKGEMTYKSEDIAWTVIGDILAESRYARLTVRSQVLLRNLLAGLERLSAEQQTFVRRRSSVDFVIYNRVTNRPLLAIEVDGFAYHENDAVQQRRDEIKNAILRVYHLPLLRLPTTGSEEEKSIRESLDEAEEKSEGDALDNATEDGSDPGDATEKR